jgi:glycine/D-amino acid oxidase-like deaminating enzyme
MRTAEPAIAGAKPVPVWLDDPRRPAARASLETTASTDLAIVGGGYSGLWTAVLAKQREPHRRVVVLEGETVGWAASGRNGGFCEASLTHGSANGLERFAGEFETLERLGADNLKELCADVERYAIDRDLEATGHLHVATEAYQVPGLREEAAVSGVDFLERDELRAEVDSPTYLAGIWSRDTVMVHPARLAWGLAEAAESLGVEIFEHSRVARMSKDAGRIELTTAAGVLVADQVALATNVFPSLLRRVRPYVVPVYDYALATEPLDDTQLASVGWRHRQGIGDSANQFHYYRLTPDNRILFGGYDAIYHFGRRINPRLDQRQKTFELLSQHFFETFPQLSGVRFTHAWGGAIDLCARFCAFFGTAHRGQVAYAAGYTGLGVGATRFGANVMLDLLDGSPTERTETAMVQSKPVPFPPEPVAWLGIAATRASLKQADRNAGRRNLWLRSLDRIGLGFDS